MYITNNFIAFLHSYKDNSLLIENIWVTLNKIMTITGMLD